jgi:hypothetical protein
VEQLVTSVARVAGDEEWRERSAEVPTTVNQMKQSGVVVGGPTLGKLVGESVALKAAEWLGVTFGQASEKRLSRPELVVTPASEVKPQPIEWFWEGHIAFGKITVLDGDPGLGKSTVLIDLASRLSTGRPMPGSDDE